ncbi:MAG TPA: amino acid ABC transporter permease [Ferrovibrio sp.]|jgi:general L-amino acid transport system permease protein|uniref:amino acid ABC transporter permease n=1 Tax=Ferrovibrio sp. TaxID=1917215 RepID=UPI002ED2C6F2
MAHDSLNGQAPARRLSWNDPDVRSVVYQIVALGLVGLVAWFLISNTLHNLSSRNIASGFGFLDREAGFAIGEGPIDFAPHNTYARAVLVGLLNTLRVAVIGIVLATLLGTIVGIARLSKNWLIAKLSLFYVETIRNVPLLLQLFFWYAVITETMPGPRQALHPLPGVFISNRGVKLPVPADHFAFDLAGVAFLIGLVLSVLVSNWAKRRQDATGQSFPVWSTCIALILGLPIFGWLIGGAPLEFDIPKLRGFNFTGGVTLTPEFAALLFGLVVYTGAFIAEVVRSGIEAVSHGQTEAAAALGLRRGQILRLVVLPQALRVIIPPMTSQYLNLTKNSSLAVAIGYPDIVSVANTAINQTGQAIEGILIIMAVYLTFSLSISLFMNWYNKHIALVER